MRAIARLTQRGGYLLVLRTTASRRMPPALRQGLAGPSPCNIGMMMYSTAPQPLAMTDPHAHKRGDLPRREVTMDDVTVSYARSGGPGGQNVNKLNTKVDMRFNFIEADFLPDWVKETLLDQHSGRINEGMLSVTSTKSRSQARNRDDALAKLRRIVGQASHLPPPPSAEVQRKVRSRLRKGNEMRMQAKKRTANKKAERKDWR